MADISLQICFGQNEKERFPTLSHRRDLRGKLLGLWSPCLSVLFNQQLRYLKRRLLALTLHRAYDMATHGEQGLGIRVTLI